MKTLWRAVWMDLLVPCVFMLLYLVDKSSQNRNHDRWEHVSIRFATWYHLPPYQSKAFEERYQRLNDVCKTDLYHGFLFARGDNMKAMPIYDLNGNLAGIQTKIPGKMHGFNSWNQSIELPPVEIMPPVLKGIQDTNGNQFYTVTAYFKHPKLICSPVIPDGVSPGRGLYIQMGYNPENDYMHIPKESRHLSPMWRKGTCVPMMGTHYFMNLSRNQPCEKLYPLFLLYDMTGSIAAFGWVFQGRPNNFYSEDTVGWFSLKPDTYPFLFDRKMLPACMFNEDFQVFGIHVYLHHHNTLLCSQMTEDTIYTTRKPKTLTQPPPQQTIKTLIYKDKNRQLDSENYIEAPDNTLSSSASKILSTQNIFSLTILSVLLTYLYAQIRNPR